MRCQDSELSTKGMSRERNSEKWMCQEKSLSIESDVKRCQEYKGMPREKTSKPGSREVAEIRKGCQEISRKKRPNKEAPERSARRMSMALWAGHATGCRTALGINWLVDNCQLRPVIAFHLGTLGRNGDGKQQISQTENKLRQEKIEAVQKLPAGWFRALVFSHFVRNHSQKRASPCELCRRRRSFSSRNKTILLMWTMRPWYWKATSKAQIHSPNQHGIWSKYMTSFISQSKSTHLCQNQPKALCIGNICEPHGSTLAAQSRGKRSQQASEAVKWFEVLCASVIYTSVDVPSLATVYVFCGFKTKCSLGRKVPKWRLASSARYTLWPSLFIQACIALRFGPTSLSFRAHTGCGITICHSAGTRF